MIKSSLFYSFLIISTISMAQPDMYQMQVKSENVSYTIYLNGVPVYEGSDQSYSTMTFPVHLYLIGNGNELTIEAEPVDTNQKGQIVAFVDPFKNGELIDMDLSPNSEERLLRMEVEKNTTASMTFDNEVFDFSKALTKGKVLNEGEVMAYGQQLAEYMSKADSEAFVGEMALKIADYASAHEYTADQMRAGLTGQFQATFFKAPTAVVDASRISVKSFNDGRFWEILLDGGEFLKYEEDGGSFQMRVYVAQPDDKIGIVR